MQNVVFGFVFSLCLVATSVAQPRKTNLTETLGWDLSYASVLDRNKISDDDFIREWLQKTEASAVKSLIENWEHEPIISAIYADYPAPHAGERIEQIFVRTRTRVFYQSFTKGRFSGSKEPLDAKKYEEVLQKLLTWEQAGPRTIDEVPVIREKTEEDRRRWGTGYWGFLSLYHQGTSRQLLLSFKDFIVIKREPTEEEVNDDDLWEKYGRENVKTGRLTKALSEIFDGEKTALPPSPNRKHKNKKRG
jgi:hypothetical protein